MKRALITGISGQDGSYLAEHLISLGYDVHGIVRRFTALHNLKKIWDSPNLHLYTGDVTDPLSVDVAMRKANPDEIYNLAGQVFVPTSWAEPNKTFKVNTGGLLNVIKAASAICPQARIYQASTSEMFGNISGACDEKTPLAPESPYGVAKLASHELCRIYRNRGMYLVSGILFNHESERRGIEMVTRKITHAVAKWYHEEMSPLVLGNLDTRRDWGYAKDYVEAMHLMLQEPDPEDYVLGTGRSWSIRDFLTSAIDLAGLDWEDVEHLIQLDPKFNRPNQIVNLQANAHKIKSKLGWQPKTSFPELVKIMIDADITRSRQVTA